LLEGNLAFDGASQNGGEKCGAGSLLKCSVRSVYSIKLNCGTGTNTRGELLALWSLLFFSLQKQVSCLHLIEDSKVIVDWFSYKNNLQRITSQPWMTRIRQFSENFQILKIQYIYREFNREVDHLSKQALLMDERSLYFSRGIGDQVDAFERLSEL
jgi:ribonuclease HI